MGEPERLLLVTATGAVIGLMLARTAPRMCARFTAYSRSPARKPLFLTAAVLFAVGSLVAFTEGNVSSGTVCLLMVALEIVALVVALRSGPDQSASS